MSVKTSKDGMWTTSDLPALEAAYKQLYLGRRVVQIGEGDTLVRYDNTPASLRQLLTIINELKGRPAPTPSIVVRTGKGL